MTGSEDERKSGMIVQASQEKSGRSRPRITGVKDVSQGFLIVLYLFCFLLFVRPMEFVSWLKIPFLLDLVCLFGVVAISRSFHRGAHHVLLSGLFISALVAPVLKAYAQILTDTASLFIKILVLYLWVANSLTTTKRLRNFLFFICILAAFLGADALGETRPKGTSFIGNVEALQMPEYRGGEPTGTYLIRIRGVGIFNDPNDLGQILATGILLMLGLLYFYPREPLYWLCGLVILGICLTGIFFTNSRGTFVALAAGIVYFFIRQTRKLFPKVMGIGACFLVFVLGPSRLASISASDGADRLELWSSAIEVFRQHPFFGVGVGGFADASEFGRTAHQSYLLALSEMGFAGFFFWFGLILYVFWMGNRIRGAVRHPRDREEKDLLNVLRIVESAMAAFLTSAYFLSRTYQFPFYLFLAFGPAMAITAKKIRPEISLDLKPREWGAFFWIAAGVTLLLYLVTRFMWRMA